MIPPAHRNRSCSSKAKLVAISRLGAALFAYTLCVLSVELKDSHLMNTAQTIKIYLCTRTCTIHEHVLSYLSVLKLAVGPNSIMFSTKWRIRWTFVFLQKLRTTALHCLQELLAHLLIVGLIMLVERQAIRNMEQLISKHIVHTNHRQH